jgi:hypothetical protein
MPLALAILFGGAMAGAQSGSPSKTGGEVVCRNGESDFASFASSVLGYDDFIEYWIDLFARYNANPCLYADVKSLSERITKAREQIRKAFYACDPQIEKLKQTYYELEAELFFLRKYVEVGSGALVVRPDAEVIEHMRQHFRITKGWFSDEKIKELFDRFKKRYQNRIEFYQNCSDPAWDNIIEKLKELKEHVQGGFGAKEAAQALARKSKNILNVPRQRSGNFLEGFLDIRLNLLEPQKALSEISAALKKELPSGYTFSQLQGAQQYEQKRYENDYAHADYLTQYEHLYKESSGSIQTEITLDLTILEKTIKGTFPYLNQTMQCTKGIVEKAC